MRNDFSRTVYARLASLSMGLLLACGGGDGGTDPPPAPDDAAAKEDAAAERAAEASAEFEQLAAGGNPDPVAALVASLQADASVSEIQQLEAGGSVIALLNGVPFSILVAQQNRAEWIAVDAVGSISSAPANVDHSGGRSSAEASAPPIACDPSNYPQSNKACILRNSELRALDEGPIEQSLQRAGFEITPLSWPTTPQAVVQLHQTLGTCGVLYILSHGGVKENLAGASGNHLHTEVEIPREENRRVLGTAFGENARQYFGAGGVGSKAVLTLSPEFFASVQYPNTLVFINACSSDGEIPEGGTRLRDAFLGSGAGAFLGWQGPIYSGVSRPAANEVFDALAPKVVVDAVTLAISPPTPSAGQPYSVSATITPAQAGVEVSLTIRGTDGFKRDETATTNASGSVTFAEVPGGEGGVTDDVTVVAGGASNSATAYDVAQSHPLIQTDYKLPWWSELTSVSVSGLTLDARADFNLVCNNQKLRESATVVKF